MEGSKEYNDILENSEDGIENLMSQYNKLLEQRHNCCGTERKVPAMNPRMTGMTVFDNIWTA